VFIFEKKVLFAQKKMKKNEKKKMKKNEKK